MNNNNTDNILYGTILVYDYEHRGDSEYAYSILSSFGITNTSFTYNGDGNVADIAFSMPYNKNKVKLLQEKIDDSPYGLTFVNLYEFESPLLGIMPKTDTPCQRTLGSIHTWSLEEAKNAKVLVVLKRYTTAYTRNPTKLVEDMDMLIRKMGCIKIDSTFISNGIETLLRGELPIKELFLNGNTIDLIKEHRITTYYGGKNQYYTPTEEYTWKEIDNLEQFLRNSIEHHHGCLFALLDD